MQLLFVIPPGPVPLPSPYICTGIELVIDVVILYWPTGILTGIPAAASIAACIGIASLLELSPLAPNHLTFIGYEKF